MPSRLRIIRNLKAILKKQTSDLKISGIIFLALSYIFLFNSEMKAAPQPEEVAQPMTLKESWSIAKDGNSELRSAKLYFELAKINYEIRKTALTFPKLDFSTEVISKSTLMQLPATEATKMGSDSYTRGYPTARVGLTLSPLTLYNSGIDSLNLNIANIEYELANRTFENAQKRTRFDLIKLYFKLSLSLKNEDIYLRAQTLAQSILTLLKVRLKLKKTTPEEVITAELDLNEVTRSLERAIQSRKMAQKEFSDFLGFPSAKKINTTTAFPDVSFNLSYEQAEALFNKNNEQLKSAEASFKKANLDYELSVREQMPIKVTIAGAAWTTEMSDQGEAHNIRTDSNPNGNIDATVSLVVTMPLWGENGFLNNQKRTEKKIQILLQENNLKNIKRSGLSNLALAIDSLDTGKAALTEQALSLNRSLELLSNKMEFFLRDTTSRTEIKELLLQTRNSELQYNERILNQIDIIVSLSNLTGMDLTESFIK